MRVWLVAGFVPMSSQSKEEAASCARCCWQLPLLHAQDDSCLRGNTRSGTPNRQGPTKARRSVPRCMQMHHAQHMQMRHLFLLVVFFTSPCLRRFLELDGFFEVSISADGLYLRSSNQESGTASCFIYKQQQASRSTDCRMKLQATATVVWWCSRHVVSLHQSFFYVALEIKRSVLCRDGKGPVGEQLLSCPFQRRIFFVRITRTLGIFVFHPSFPHESRRGFSFLFIL